MSITQRWLVIATMAGVAVLLSFNFLQFAYKRQVVGIPILVLEKSPDARLFETSDGVPVSGDEETGLFASVGRTESEALLGGIVVPIILLAGAGYIHLGRRPG
jgi:hypothetical protein